MEEDVFKSLNLINGCNKQPLDYFKIGIRKNNINLTIRII